MTLGQALVGHAVPAQNVARLGRRPAALLVLFLIPFAHPPARPVM